MLYLFFPVGGVAGLWRLLFGQIVNNNSYPIIPLPSQLSCYKNKPVHTDNFGMFLIRRLAFALISYFLYGLIPSSKADRTAIWSATACLYCRKAKYRKQSVGELRKDDFVVTIWRPGPKAQLTWQMDELTALKWWRFAYSTLIELIKGAQAWDIRERFFYTNQRLMVGTVTFFIQTFFIRDKVYT